MSNAKNPSATALPDTKPAVSLLFVETSTDHGLAEHTSTSYTSWGENSLRAARKSTPIRRGQTW